MLPKLSLSSRNPWDAPGETRVEGSVTTRLPQYFVHKDLISSSKRPQEEQGLGEF